MTDGNSNTESHPTIVHGFDTTYYL